jgi:hypothetical protein
MKFRYAKPSTCSRQEMDYKAMSQQNIAGEITKAVVQGLLMA